MPIDGNRQAGKTTPDRRERMRVARPFLVMSVLAIIAGGLIAGIVAHAPTRPMVWMVAYLVLVVGVAQAVFGAAQAWLPATLSSRSLRHAQWWLFNLGSAGVIAGRLMRQPDCVAFGTTLFILALAAFLWGTRRASKGWLVIIFRTVLILLFLGACTGLVLSFFGLTR